ncbi:MAG: putative membrane-bound dehydrogenase-like protein [Saprospiraceae bacterium]|jgi:putative membrane-bound dehydrogenase-like protein
MLKYTIKGMECGALIFLMLIVLNSCSVDSSQLPEGFEIEAGFNMQLIASEPLIKDPVDLEFDEHGDAYVLEMPGYPFEEQESRVIVLKDDNGDGIYDNSIVYAENLELASSLMPYKQGILIAAPPYLLYLKDTDGDHKADKRDTIMSGFSTGNLQHNFNGLTYGIDNWIYIANGGNSGSPYWWGDTTNVIDLREDDIRINIEKRIVERVGVSSGGYELGIDEYGRIYETHNLKHISQLIFPMRYARNLSLSPRYALSNVSDHEENGLSRIYPIGEQESRVNHPEQSGYFSGSCGITYYGGGELGKAYDQSIWVADVVLNLIHVDKLSPNGAGFKASRVLEKRDFLVSSDRSFRPVNMTVGPDGSMFVLDMHREVIEHPEWIPDDIEKTLDLEAGKENGRIYKITRDGSQTSFDFKQYDALEGLIKQLAHQNQWVRNTAHRVLLDRDLTKEDINLITEAAQGENAYARLHSMWILAASNSTSSELIIDKLQDSDAGIRENALIIAESRVNESDGIIASCIALLTDSNQRVRMQAALTLSTISIETFNQHRENLLVGLIRSSKLEIDQWNAQAISLAGKEITSDIFEAIIDDNERPVIRTLLTSLATIGAKDELDVLRILRSLASSQINTELKAEIIDAISKHLPSKSRNLNQVTPIKQLEEENDLGLLAALAGLRKKLSLSPSSQFMSKSKVAIIQVTDRSRSDELRLKQMSLLELLPYASKSDLLYSLLSNKESLKLQEQALMQLSDSSHPEIGRKLVGKWQELGPQSRRTASDILLYKQAHHDALLTGLENGTINIGEMNFDLERRRTLLWWTDDERTKKRAEALFSDSGVVNRKEAIENMKEALSLTGSLSKGTEVFNQLCAQCHIYGSSGTDAGPILTEINRKSKESLIHDILDPNAAVDTKYINHRLETNDGTLHIGMVDIETDVDITIKKMGGSSVTVAKEDMKSFTSLGTSMMLEGLEANMSHQDMADLLAFLQQRN